MKPELYVFENYCRKFISVLWFIFNYIHMTATESVEIRFQMFATVTENITEQS